MAPAAMLEHDDGRGDLGSPTIEMASAEIENMRASKSTYCYHSFPPACLDLLKSIEGNQRCIDCGERNPQWAAVSYGALLCLHCSGHHRSLGVQVSCVRSVSMDDWSVEEIVSMLEGGNSQLAGFFSRHALSVETCAQSGRKSQHITPENVTRLRYKTKAAQFYKNQMEIHVKNMLEAGEYKGRDNARRGCHHQLDRRNSNTD